MEILSELSLPQRLALSYGSTDYRDKIAAYFAFDARLSRILRQSTEPMLVQIRLAWWRDMLGKPPSERPTGDLVLDSLSAWEGLEEQLTDTVDAWEILLADNLDRNAIEQFTVLRTAPLPALALQSGEGVAESVDLAARRWALADLTAHLASSAERAAALDFSLALPARRIIGSRKFRSLAVLDGLAARSLGRGGRALLDGTGTGLLALRIGLFGR